jgi:hypothetical protein
MAEHRLTLTLEGLPADDGHVRLTDFLRELQLLSSTLLRAERAIAPEGRPGTTYRIVDLSHSSPARVVIEAYAKRQSPDLRRAIIGTVFAALSQLQKNEVPDVVDAEFLEDLHEMARPVGKTLARVTLASNNNEEVVFSPKFRETVAEILAPQLAAHGFIRGKLEAINLHGSANVFKIYPHVGPAKVACHFPSALLDEAIRAVNHDVEVHGLLRYRTHDPFPHAVEVARIVVLEREREGPPGFDDLLGRAPHLADGIPAEDWIARKRLEQEEEVLAILGVNT